MSSIPWSTRRRVTDYLLPRPAHSGFLILSMGITYLGTQQRTF
jgi:hypothetical protein